MGPESRGVAARARLEALSAGPREVTARADVARGRRRPTRAHLAEAVQGSCTPPHRCLLPESFSQRDAVDAAIDRVRAGIRPSLAAAPEARALLATLPGGRQRTAESLLAARGTAMPRVPRAKQLAAWAGMGPGQDDRGGQRLSGKTRPGRRWRRPVGVEAAHVAAKTQPTSLAAPYQRMAARRGKPRARMALGPTLVGIV